MKNQKKKVVITRPSFLLILFLAAVILHNLISGLLGIEEPVFFFLALLLGLCLVISVIYDVVFSIVEAIIAGRKAKRPKGKKKL